MAGTSAGVHSRTSQRMSGTLLVSSTATAW